MGNIDFFKKVNDTYGHQYGDYVLKTVADLLSQGYYVVAEVKGNTGQHWVAIDNVSGDTIYMMDPGSDATEMWKQLSTVDSTKLIDPSHIAGNLTVSTITLTGQNEQGNSVEANYDVSVIGEISAVGNITSQSGVAALKEHEA